MGRGLSERQRSLLTLITTRINAVNKHKAGCEKRDCWCRSVPMGGTPWALGRELSGAGYNWTRGRAAVMSRSLDRLEARGLIIRRNRQGYGMQVTKMPDFPMHLLSRMGPRRTCYVELTEAGKDIAASVEANG